MNVELPEFRALGVVRCAAKEVADVPSEGLPSDVVLHERYLGAMTGVEVGDYMYVIAVFHRANPNILSGSPGTANEQGAFSIRSSCRPNLIGMTLAKVTAVNRAVLSFDWLDFCEGTPVLDLKRYNWRWECALSTRRLDRRFIEHQISTEALSVVLMRPAANFHGEHCAWVTRAGELAARLVHEHDVWLGSPTLHVAVEGDGHLVDAFQGITGATLGNGRLSIRLVETDRPIIRFAEARQLVATCYGNSWVIA